MINIIHNNNFKNSYLTLEETLNICINFLKTIDDKYVKDFNKALIDGTFDIYDVDDDFDSVNGKVIEDGYFIIRNEKGNCFKSIRIGLHHNISDVYRIMQEFYYFENELNIFEFKLYDYLNNNFTEDNKLIRAL